MELPAINKRKPLELIVLTDPYFVKCLLDKRSPNFEELELKKKLKLLMARFDEIKFTDSCHRCIKPAKYVAFFNGTFFSELWCGDCSPFWLENFAGSMDIFSTYRCALDYAAKYCRDDRMLFRALILQIARLKGLPEKLDAKEAIAFFRLTAESDVQRPKSNGKTKKKTKTN